MNFQKPPVWFNPTVMLKSSPDTVTNTVQKGYVLVLLVTSSVIASDCPGSERSACSFMLKMGDSCVYSFLSLTMEWKQGVHNVKVEFHIVSPRLWTPKVLIQITMCYQSLHALWMALYTIDNTTVLCCTTVTVIHVVTVIMTKTNVLFPFVFSSGNKPDRYLHRVAASWKSP